ncbi:hypothetical protein BD410DRAFT_635658 [Rickenella mellea]|uniref:Uncharacterized protein n=1 Tax=Rickenella mellea TaxID=50990 RepID=A0A4Y7QCL0_9AGAM|nr:hypothetical protein BD410DRAFT_635658 [Rickenella mellea]
MLSLANTLRLGPTTPTLVLIIASHFHFPHIQIPPSSSAPTTYSLSHTPHGAFPASRLFYVSITVPRSCSAYAILYISRFFFIFR